MQSLRYNPYLLLHVYRKKSLEIFKLNKLRIKHTKTEHIFVVNFCDRIDQ